MSAATAAEYRYKDANRDWWKLTLERGRPDRDGHDPGIVDHWWDYTLSKEGDAAGEYRPVWSGEVFAQYDHLPTVANVLSDFARGAAALAVGFASSQRG